MADLVAEGYDAVYAAWPTSPTFHALWARHAVDGRCAPGFEHLSFATLDDQRRIGTALRAATEDRLLDLCCGAGGPGLWIARETGAALIGVDLSPVGLRLAAQRATDHGMGNARFVAATATAIGLADACATAAMSIDALQYVEGKRAAFGEVARVLSPGGRFAFAAFELEPDRVAGLPVLGVDPVADYGPLLRDAGFDIEVYEETPEWKNHLEAAYSAIVAEQETLTREMGDHAFGALLLEMTLTLEVAPYRRRVFVVARAPTR